jgi:hypothetical protein
MGIAEVLTAQQSPWQNPFADRLIGSIRRECLDHVIVLWKRSICKGFCAATSVVTKRRVRILSLSKDALSIRTVQPQLGSIVEIPQVGGLRHRYEWRAA